MMDKTSSHDDKEAQPSVDMKQCQYEMASKTVAHYTEEFSRVKMNLEPSFLEQLSHIEAAMEDGGQTHSILSDITSWTQLGDGRSADIVDHLTDHGLPQFTGQLWQLLHQEKERHVQQMNESSDVSTCRDTICLLLLSNLTEKCVLLSSNFCHKFTDLGTHKFVIAFISKSLLEPYIQKADSNTSRFLHTCIHIIFYLSRKISKSTENIRHPELVTEERLLTILRSCPHSYIRLAAAQCISSLLANEKKDSDEPIIRETVTFLLKCTRDVCVNAHQESTIDLIMGSMEIILVCDEAKKQMHNQSGLGPLLEILEADRGISSKQMALNCVWKLSLDDTSRECMKVDDKLRVILTLALEEESEAVKMAAVKIISSLDEEDSEPPTQNTGQLLKESENYEVQNSEQPIRIMLSYSWEQQDLVKCIRDGLKQAGFQVWMDIDCIGGGSLLENIATAVERCDCILIAISEGFKASKHCKTEAEYAYRIGKKIIPLRVQRDYVATGWLGALMANDLYYEAHDYICIETQIAALVNNIRSDLRKKSTKTKFEVS